MRVFRSAASYALMAAGIVRGSFLERNLAVDRDSQKSNFGDHPESQTGMHITYGMH